MFGYIILHLWIQTMRCTEYVHITHKNVSLYKVLWMCGFLWHIILYRVELMSVYPSIFIACGFQAVANGTRTMKKGSVFEWHRLFKKGRNLLVYKAASTGNFSWPLKTETIVPKRRQEIITTHCVMTQKSAVLAYFVAEAWNLAGSRKVCSTVQKFPAGHTKAAPNGKCCEGYIVPSMVRLMYQLKSVLK